MGKPNHVDLSNGEFIVGRNCRITVVGTSGSGKTTLARQLYQRLALTHIELDALHWLPGWQEAPLELLRSRVQGAVASGSWTIDGNYSKVRDLVLSRADTLIWLDYSLAMIMGRVVRRTLKRTLTREKLWGGNREGLRQAFLSRDSIIWWALTTYKRRRSDYLKMLASPAYAHLTILHFHSPRQTRRWLEKLPK